MITDQKITVERLLCTLIGLTEIAPKIDQIINLLSTDGKVSSGLESEQYFTVEELSDYLPGRPAVSTLRGKYQRREIPGRKNGKRIVFLKSEIDQWLKGERASTQSELKDKVEVYLSSGANRKAKNCKTATHVATGRSAVTRSNA